MTNQERRERWAIYGGWEKARTLEDVEEAPERSEPRSAAATPQTAAQRPWWRRWLK
jgi:hypothetical protein